MNIENRNFSATAALVGLAASLLALAIWSTIEFKSFRQAAPPDDSYKTRIIEARGGLSEGLLVYTIIGDSKAGDSLHFEATLHGSREGKPAIPDGKGEESAPSGAIMGAKLHCSGADVKCVANSSEKKPVLRTKDVASWSWTIDTPKAGKAVINLTITAYLNDTDTVLEEPIPVRQELEIHHSGKAFPGFIQSAWKEIIAVLTAIGGLGGLLAFWQYRRTGQGSSGNGDVGRSGSSNSSGARDENL
ncbi:hypothetical protein [Streptomyces sp. B22F1]|uniref:hypothetical protein n=1 Tax=Streptomyces sp. B22F1 TaxID=3153566 RepID=UPI00325F279A